MNGSKSFIAKTNQAEFHPFYRIHVAVYVFHRIQWISVCSLDLYFSFLSHIFFSFQGDCWICMELMSTSFDKFYKYVYSVLDDVIPEEILGKITLAVSILLNLFVEDN